MADGIDDQAFLSETLRLAERLLDQDDIWSAWVLVPEMSSEDRLKLVATGREMQVGLVQLAGRVDRVSRLTEHLLRPDSELFIRLPLVTDALKAEYGIELLPAQVFEAFGRGHGDLPLMRDALLGDLPILIGKVNRLERGENLEDGDLRAITRRLLIGGLVCVVAAALIVTCWPAAATVAGAAVVAHVGAAVHVGTTIAAHIPWRALDIACLARAAMQLH